MPITARYESLKDRVFIVTGGGQGLGRAYSLELARQGAIPVIADLNADKGDAVAREIRSANGKALAVRTDVADETSTKAMAAAALKEYGRIDGLINNAALFSVITMAPFWELPVDEWERAMRINITGAFFCARAVVPAMMERKWGRIINVTSTTVPTGRANYLHYISSKSALVGMTRSMARELGPYNITTHLLQPGAVATEVERPSVSGAQFDNLAKQQALQRRAEIDDIVSCMMFLCSEGAAYTTGQTLTPNGGIAFV